MEIQVRNQPSLFKREQFYLASFYVEQLKSGKKYGALNKAIGILITVFPCFEDAYWCHRFRYYDKEHDVTLPDSCEMIILELPKVGADSGALADWLRFVKAKNREDFMQAAVHNPLINKAVGIITTLSEDEEMRLLAESREKALRDMWDRVDEARAEGRAEKSREIAKNFLMAGIAKDVVAQNTGLSREEVETIAVLINQ